MIEIFIPRQLGPHIQKAAQEFPAVVVVGPRQSGKTTLLANLFGGRYPIISLEPPDIRLAAQSDPRGFLNLYPPPVIFDEIQYAPGLLPYIKEKIDDNRNQTGQFILTGSQNLLLMSQVTESLAGRTAVLRLLPLSLREAAQIPGENFPWEGDSSPRLPSIPPSELWNHILRGSYPEPVVHPERDPRLWQASYIQTYLERDSQEPSQPWVDLTQFQVSSVPWLPAAAKS